MPAECIAFSNYKGGTGKTTSCLSIAGYLAKDGRKVLVVDFDPQANATSGLGINPLSLKRSIYDAVLRYCPGYKGVSILRVIVETGVDNLHLAPSEPDLVVAEALMQKARAKTGILNRILEEVRPSYDYILVDLPPSSGLLTINGLCAANEVVIPLEPSIFSLESVEALKASINDISRKTRHSINGISAILIRYIEPNVFVDMFGSPNASQETEARLRKMFQTVFLVPESAKIYECQKKGMPISHHAPKSRVGAAYQKIAKYISTDSSRKAD